MEISGFTQSWELLPAIPKSGFTLNGYNGARIWLNPQMGSGGRR
jgi:hypothetical protein